MATELEKLESQIKDLQDKRKSILDGQRKEKLKEAKALIAQFGFTASDLGLSPKDKQTKPKGEPMYAHPKDPALTWAGGKGRKPQWIKEYLEGGGNLDALKIKK